MDREDTTLIEISLDCIDQYSYPDIINIEYCWSNTHGINTQEFQIR